MASRPSPDSEPQRRGEFDTTHWSLVLAARNQGGDACSDALGELCRAYWPPLYAYVRRRVGDQHEAQDLTQAFFERLLEKEYLSDVDPARGRFRAFLITAFRHFLSKEWDKAKAQKRGGGRNQFISDFSAVDSVWMSRAEQPEPDALYERQWAITLLGRVMNELKAEMTEAGKAAHFEILKDFIAGAGTQSYDIAAVALGTTEAAARMAASRMRNRYGQLLRREIAQTVGSEADVDDELKYLFRVFGN